jgi:predicted signal transduction protein with EAL and GGDEF domain
MTNSSSKPMVKQVDRGEVEPLWAAVWPAEKQAEADAQPQRPKPGSAARPRLAGSGSRSLEVLGRRPFERRLGHDLDLVRRDGRMLALVVLQLQDAFAQAAAADRAAGPDQAGCVDGLGQVVLRRIARLLRPGDSMAMLAPDEVAIIQMPIGDSLAAHRLAARLLHVLTRPLRLGEQAIELDPCIGLALYPCDGSRADLLVERAQAAALRARHWGGKGFCFSNQQVAGEVAGHLALEHEIRQAAQQGELALTFEPILDLRQGGMASAKASLLWRHPNHGPLAATAFLPIAERAGMTQALGWWSLQQACEQAAGWHRRNQITSLRFQPLAEHLRAPDFVSRLRGLLSRCKLPPIALDLALDPALGFEVTDHRLRANLDQLAVLGVGLTLLGFGDGPVDVAQLLELPIQRLELGPCLVATIGRSRTADIALQALTDLGLRLGKEVAADGVASDEQLRRLVAAGCAAATGPLIGPALPASEFARTLAQRPLIETSRGPIVALH